jgi:hypothetical protein
MFQEVGFRLGLEMRVHGKFREGYVVRSVV